MIFKYKKKNRKYKNYKKSLITTNNLKILNLHINKLQ